MNRTQKSVFSALATAILCVVAPFSLNIGAVPISLSTFVIIICAGFLGKTLGSLSVAVYIILGLCGLPIFSNFLGGPQVLFGITGGFVLGYLPLAFLTGLFYDKFKTVSLRILGTVLGLTVLYIIGIIWFIFIFDNIGFSAIVIYFLPIFCIDILKAVLATFILTKVRK